MRILMIGPGNNGKYGDRFFYSYNRRIQNGFIRNGHFVQYLSDRDMADYALKFRPVGSLYANYEARKVARNLQPHLIVLVHAELITLETLQELT